MTNRTETQLEVFALRIDEGEMTLVNALADEIETFVVAMVTTPWPTTPDEYTLWAELIGLPTTGEPDRAMDDSMPWSTHFTVPSHPWDLSWHYFQREFVGVSLFLDAEMSPHERLAFARELRGRFDARWVPLEWIDSAPPLTSFTCYWLPGECMVDFYWHAPQVDPLGGASSGMVQLAVMHYARMQAEDKVASEHEISWCDPAA